MTDLSAFQAQMGLALYEALNSDIRFARFAGRVLETDGLPDTEANRAALKLQLAAGIERGAAEAREARRAGLYPLAKGYGRLDALGRGGKFLFGTLYGDPRNMAVADGPVSYPALWDASWFD